MTRTFIVLLAASIAVLAVPASCVAGEPVASDFTYLGSPHTKWEPGGNSALEFITSPPNGPWRPGGATFSMMGAGFRDASGFDNTHGSFRTVAITSLDVPGFTSPADYAHVIDWALDQWDSVSGFANLGEVPDGGVDAGALEVIGGHLGDIRIAAWEIVSPGTIARAFQPGTEDEFGPGGTISGDLFFDVNRAWIDSPTAAVGEGFDIYTVALHEIGHALGLGHSSTADSVMRAGYFGARRTLAPDDMAGIQALYGPQEVPEPSAVALAVLAAAGLVLARLRRRGGAQARVRRRSAEYAVRSTKYQPFVPHPCEGFEA